MTFVTSPEVTHYFQLILQVRYSKNVGLGFKTPNEAKDGVYIDKKCPFTGLVQIRGRC